jgi:hypothetical protein
VPQTLDTSEAVVMLPPVRGRLADRSLVRWLSRGMLEAVSTPVDALAEVLGALGRETPAGGRAALRLWGQAGERPASWIAAADPVCMEPRLDRLFLHALGPGEVSAPELQRLLDALQETLGDDGAIGFARLDECAYIRSEQALATAAVPAARVDGQNPDGYLPSGNDAAATLNLISEIEMALHEQPINAERVARGLPPVNSLWLWGGGFAPEATIAPVPPLYGDEPTLRGYWESVGGTGRAWPGSLGACLDDSGGGLVAVVPPATAPDELGAALATLRKALHAGRLDRLRLIAADGVRATLRAADRFRVWRRTSNLLEDAAS